MKIEQFTRPVCREFSARVIEALKPLAGEFGLQVAHKGGRFDASNYTLKVEFSVLRDGGIAMNEEAVNYNTLHVFYGLPADGLGKEVAWSGRTFKVTGLRPKRRKCPLCVVDPATNRSYLIPVQALGGKESRI